MKINYTPIAHNQLLYWIHLWTNHGAIRGFYVDHYSFWNSVNTVRLGTGHNAYIHMSIYASFPLVWIVLHIKYREYREYREYCEYFIIYDYYYFCLISLIIINVLVICALDVSSVLDVFKSFVWSVSIDLDIRMNDVIEIHNGEKKIFI